MSIGRCRKFHNASSPSCGPILLLVSSMPSKGYVAPTLATKENFFTSLPSLWAMAGHVVQKSNPIVAAIILTFFILFNLNSATL